MAVAQMRSFVFLLVLGSLVSCAFAATIPNRTTPSAVADRSTSSGAMTSRELQAYDQFPVQPGAAPAPDPDASDALPAQTTPFTTSRDLHALPSIIGSESALVTLHDLHLTDLSIPPEVIMEALFSQIDLIQDLLEQCEEKARNDLNGDSSQETVDMDNSGSDDVDNSREIALAASILFRGTSYRNPRTARPGHDDDVPVHLDSEELLSEEDNNNEGGDDVTAVSNGRTDLDSDRHRHPRRDDVVVGGGGDGNGDDIVNDDLGERGKEVQEAVEGWEQKEDHTGKGDNDLNEDLNNGKEITENYRNERVDDALVNVDRNKERRENEGAGDEKERKMTANEPHSNDGTTIITTTNTFSTIHTSSKKDSSSDILATSDANDSLSPSGVTNGYASVHRETVGRNPLNLNENTKPISHFESDDGGDVHEGKSASTTTSDLVESSGETTLSSILTSIDELGPVGHGDDNYVSVGHRIQRSVSQLNEPVDTISEGEGEEKATSEQRGKSQVQRSERHTIKLTNENLFSEEGHIGGKSKRENVLVALQKVTQKLESDRRLRKLPVEEQLFAAEREYKRAISKLRSRDDKDFVTVTSNEDHRSKTAGLQQRSSLDPTVRSVKRIVAESLTLKSSDSWQELDLSDRRPVHSGVERLFAGLTASKSERLRARRSADLETHMDPERFVPLIGHLVERLDYLKRSLAECHSLLESEQRNDHFVTLSH